MQVLSNVLFVYFLNIGCLKETECTCTHLSRPHLVEVKRSYLDPNISGEARTESHIARQKKYILRCPDKDLIVITKRNLLHDYLSFSIAFPDAILER